jgi:hypothetical protein
MLRRNQFILWLVCMLSVAFCALLLLQKWIPMGVGWGDGVSGRAYSVELEGAVVLRTASGMKAAPPGNYLYTVQMLSTLEGAGVQYHRWNMTAGPSSSAPVLGRFAEVRIAAEWPLLLSLAVVCLCLARLVKARRNAAGRQLCPHCGYDLRASFDRCPECGEPIEIKREAARAVER